jgi:HSP20 family protein
MTLLSWLPHKETTERIRFALDRVLPLQRELARIIDGVLFGPRFSLLETFTNFHPRVNVVEGEHEYRITTELPGVERSDVELSYGNGMLILKGEKHMERSAGEGTYTRLERTSGFFQRTIPLRQAIDLENLDAYFKSGILTIIAPKLNDFSPQNVPIPIRTLGTYEMPQQEFSTDEKTAAQSGEHAFKNGSRAENLH